MKIKILLVFTFLLITYGTIAQTIATNETKIIVAVNKTDNTIDKLVFYNTFKELSTKEVEKKYPKNAFYLGLLKGLYTVENNEIQMGKEATLTLYSNKQYYPKDNKFSSEKIKIGNSIIIGSAKTQVVSNKDGEITIKTINQ
ncbi:hypothetical protein EGM88_09665 [Aureibaculum marinum]|uniref:Cyclophilin-like domain-containing protein n=1 Tax=Aureibaculum marinum TaxID=2487930 RepID=A0A3N4NWR1_9FLAO|nr:hypothetical protein [Aureibaculum marinum]RPD96620.1 hypothetical protein EGM88_09665 [Aureibaculum marinum]